MPSRSAERVRQPFRRSAAASAGRRSGLQDRPSPSPQLVVRIEPGRVVVVRRRACEAGRRVARARRARRRAGEQQRRAGESSEPRASEARRVGRGEAGADAPGRAPGRARPGSRTGRGRCAGRAARCRRCGRATPVRLEEGAGAGVVRHVGDDAGVQRDRRDRRRRSRRPARAGTSPPCRRGRGSG